MKKIFLVIASIVVLLLIAAGVLVMMLNPIAEKLKPTIVKILSETLKTEVTVGSVRAKIFPRSSIEVEDVTIGGTTPSAAKVGTLSLESSPFDLLKGNLAVSKALLSGATITAIRDERGAISVAGIEVVKPPQAGKEIAPNALTVNRQSQGNEGKGKELPFAAKDISLKNISLRFIDRSVTPAQTVEMDKIDAQIENLSFVEDSSFRLKARVLGAKSESLDTSGRFSLSSITNGSPQIEAKGSLSSLDLAQVAKIAEVYKPLPLSLSGSGDLQFNIKCDHSIYSGNVTLDLKEATIEKKDSFSKRSGFPLKAVSQFVFAENKDLQLKDVKLLFGESEIAADAIVKADKSIAFSIKNSTVKIEDAGKIVPAASPFSGSIVVDLKGALPSQANSFPLLLGSAALKTISGKLPGKETAERDLRDLNGDIAFEKDHITVRSLQGTLDGEKISAELSADVTPQLITLRSASFHAFDGNLKAQGSISPGNELPLQLSVNGGGFDITRIMKDLNPGSKFTFSGIISTITAALSGEGKNLVRTAAGTASFAVSKGAIQGFNVLGSVVGQISTLPGLGGELESIVPPQFLTLIKGNSTEFDSLNLDLMMKGGVFNLTTLKLTHSLYLLTGSGTATADGNFEVKTQLRLTPVLTGPMVAHNKELQYFLDKDQNVTVPAIIRKEGDHVSVRPDTSELAKSAAGNAAKKAAEKAIDKYAPGLGGEAKKALDSLFK